MNRKAVVPIAAAGVILAAIMAFIIYFVYFSNPLYRSYDVVSEWKREDSNTVRYLPYGENYLKYSKDGASAFDHEGKILWNGGYEMEVPYADICGEYVAVCNAGGKECYIFNGKDSGTRIETTLPIVKARVAEQGIVAVLLEDADSNVINIYNPYSNVTPLIVEIPTNITESGYPVDFDISDDGSSLVVSYLTVKNGTSFNQVNFYNFSEVGQDKNRLISGKTFEDSMITGIEFAGSDTVVIFHEKGFSVFDEMKQPEETVKLTFDDKIRSAVLGGNHVGVILNKTEREGSVLELYDLAGNREMTRDITYDYETVACYNDELIFTTEKKCNILRCNGEEKFKFGFDRSISYFLPGSGSNKYLIIDDNVLQEIKVSG